MVYYYFILLYLANCVISCTQCRKLVSIRVHILFRAQNRVYFLPRGNFGAIRATQKNH